jgi:hypothetical protein
MVINARHNKANQIRAIAPLIRAIPAHKVNKALALNKTMASVHPKAKILVHKVSALKVHDHRGHVRKVRDNDHHKTIHLALDLNNKVAILNNARLEVNYLNRRLPNQVATRHHHHHLTPPNRGTINILYPEKPLFRLPLRALLWLKLQST